MGTESKGAWCRWMARVREINELEPLMRSLTADELRNKTEEFRMRLAAGQATLDALLPEAFAVVREASRRALNLRHYDVQLVSSQPSVTLMPVHFFRSEMPVSDY